MKQLLDTDPLIEPSHMPHLHRMWLGEVPAPVAVAVATQRDGTLRLLPTSPNPLQAEIDRSDAAEEGGVFRTPAPARVPRARKEVDLWVVLGIALVCGLGVPFLIAVGSEVIQFLRVMLP